MSALLSFSAADIRVDGMAVDVLLPASWIARKLSDTEIDTPESDGRVHGRLSRSGATDIVVRTRVSARLTVPCVRCLEPAPIHVDADLSLLLAQNTRADGPRGRDSARRRNGGRDSEEYEFQPDEAHQDTYDGEVVVLDDFVREILLLEVPSFPLCRDDCPGIQAALGAELPPAADPRLAPLSAFREDDGGPVGIEALVAAAQKRAELMRGGSGNRASSPGKRAVLRSSHKGKRKR